MNLLIIIAVQALFFGLLILLLGRQKAQRFLLLDIFRGLRVTGRAFFQRKVTQHYPDEGEALPISPRFKGMLALRQYPNGEERCIACKLCEAVCPALAITIEAEPRGDGSRRTTRFDIDTFKCINCGLCEEACPVDSIVCTDEMHYSVLRRGDNIMTKDQLLMLGNLYEEKIVANQLEDVT